MYCVTAMMKQMNPFSSVFWFGGQKKFQHRNKVPVAHSTVTRVLTTVAPTKINSNFNKDKHKHKIVCGS